jgi:hypothetical protein
MGGGTYTYMIMRCELCRRRTTDENESTGKTDKKNGTLPCTPHFVEIKGQLKCIYSQTRL